MVSENYSGVKNRLMPDDSIWKHQLRQGPEDLCGDLEKVWGRTHSSGSFCRTGQQIGYGGGVGEPCDWEAPLKGKNTELEKKTVGWMWMLSRGTSRIRNHPKRRDRQLTL